MLVVFRSYLYINNFLNVNLFISRIRELRAVSQTEFLPSSERIGKDFV